ncbi:2-dehydropantoate 2-reductase [Thozetella sp. PMI_491]|nr:2-dehydropantoate 2-reductase [Thozetella sp. PMI_491]
MPARAKILVVGCGAVGTMCAFELHKSGLCDVTVVLRSNYETVKSLGFHIRSIEHGEIPQWKPDNVEKSVPDSLAHGPFDYVVVAMKSLPDVYSIPAIIQTAITPRVTSIVLIQNGLDIEQPFIEAFPESILLSGVTMIGCELNGHKVLHNDPDVLYLAPFPQPAPLGANQDHFCSRFSKLYEAGGSKCVVVDDIVWHRWRKLVWNSPFNSVCALTNVDSGTILDTGCNRALIRPAMDEIVAVAEAAGYKLSDGIQEEMMMFTDKDVRLRPSMQIDAIKGRPMEIEVILGNPLRIARRLGVKTCILDILYELLKAKQETFKSAHP